MRLTRLLASAALLGSPALATAQGSIDPACPGTTQRQALTQDACQKAVDIFSYLAPQLSGALSTNPVTPIGNFLPLSFSAGVVQGYVPLFSTASVSTSGARSSNYDVKKTPIPMPAVTGNLTLYNGVQTPLGRMGGVSAIVTLTVLPDVTISDLSVSTLGSGFGVGGGAQVRVLEEGTWIPELSGAWLRRRTPDVLLLASTANGDTLRADSTSVRTRTIRIEASKHLGWVGFVAGASQDHADARSIVSGSVQVDPASAALLGLSGTQSVDPVVMGQTSSRTTHYVGATLGIFRATIGQISGGSFAPTYNTFSEPSASGSGTATPRPVEQSYRFGAASITLNF